MHINPFQPHHLVRPHTRLEQEVYISRNGDQYAYLTDREKDMESEIKNLPVETADINTRYRDLFFPLLSTNSRLTCSDSGRTYDFVSKVDGTAFSNKGGELSINFLSPGESYDATGNIGAYELAIVPDDQGSRLADEVRLFIQTRQYLRRASQDSPTGNEDLIKLKTTENDAREKKLKALMEKSLEHAELYIRGERINPSGSCSVSAIKAAFEKLVATAYPNLPQLGGANYSKEDIARYLNESNLFNGTDQGMGEAEQTLLNDITRQSKSDKVTVSGMCERFAKVPYGWQQDDVLCLLAKLHARAKLIFKLNGNEVAKETIPGTIANKTSFPQLTIEILRDYTPAQLRTLKEFYHNFFNTPAEEVEVRPLLKSFQKELSKLISTLQERYTDRDRYPFMVSLAPHISRLSELLNGGEEDLLATAAKHDEVEELATLMEETLRPMIQFTQGGNKCKELYDKSTDKLRQPGMTDLPEAEDLRRLLDAPDAYKKPPDIQRITETLRSGLAQALADQKAASLAEITQIEQKLQAEEPYTQATDTARADVAQQFADLRNRVNIQSTPAGVRDLVTQFEKSYPAMLTELGRSATPPPPAPVGTGATQATPAEAPVATAPTYVSISSIPVHQPKSTLTADSDVDEYVRNLAVALKKALLEGKKITL